MITIDDLHKDTPKVFDTFHEVANIFPLMYGDEFKELEEDIRVNGLLQPIIVYQNKIIDGRNRYLACIQNGITPRFEEWNGEGSLLDYVLSLNLKRRHLTSSQKAMVALELEKHLAEEAKEKERERKTTLEIFPKSDVKPIHAAQQAAAIIGTNSHYVTDAKRLTIEAPELARYVLDGSLTIPQAKAIVNRDGIPVAVPHISSKNNEWYTPIKYINAARELMGSIDLDPASCEEANRTVAAANYYDSTQNGLETPWCDRVWLNPPYGYTNGESNQALWSNRLIDQYINGNVTQAILLVNAAVDTNWFHRLLDFPVCLTRGRINFTTPEPTVSGSTHGSAFVYFGSQVEKFVEIFSEFGTVVRRW